MSDSVETQVQWLVDRAKISDLLHSFASSLDTKDYEGYAANFVDGGHVEIPDPTSTTGETFLVYKERMSELMPHGLGKYSGTHHLSTNHQIAIDGDAATSRSYLQAVHIGSTPMDHWTGGGWYDCTYRRTPQGWKFVSVKLTVLWLTGTPLEMRPK